VAHRQIQVQKDTTQERVQFRVLPGGYSHASGVCPGATNLGPKRYRVPSLYCTIWMKYGDTFVEVECHFYIVK